MKIILLALTLLAAAAVAGVAQPHFAHSATAAPADTRTITVTGTGTVTAVPDRASFDFGVDVKAATAADALARSASLSRAVIAALESAGVAKADLQTTQVSLNPQSSPDGTSIVGYEATGSVSATAAIAKAGSIVDAAVGAGATTVSGPGLSRSDADALGKQALAKAVDDAKARAQALADAAGVSLGRVESIVDGGGASPMPFAGKASFGAADVPVEPGTQDTTATVTVTYLVS